MIASMDLADAWATFWPWLWPSLILLVWVVATVWGIRRWRRWITDRFGQRTAFASERFMRTLARVMKFSVVAAGVYAWALVVPIEATFKDSLRADAEPWILATLVLIAVLGAGFYGLRRALVWLEARAAATDTQLDDALIEALNRPVYVTLVLVAINLWAAIVPIPPAVQSYVAKGSETTIIVLIVLFIDGLVQGWMVARAERSKVLKTSGVVLRTSARVVLYVVGFLMALSSLGFDVTPALATLGIGSAAVGFALQGTVTDFLAGIMIAADQPVSVGDYIRIDDVNQGWVLSIGWRTTRLLTRYDMHVIVPNSKLAQAMFLNTSRPREEIRYQPAIHISYREDLDRVVRIVSEVAESVQREDPRAIPNFRAFGWVEMFQHGYAEVRCWQCAKNYDAHFGMRDTYFRRVHKRLREEGIAIVGPVRSLEVQPGTSLPLSLNGQGGGLPLWPGVPQGPASAPSPAPAPAQPGGDRPPEAR